MDSTYARRIAEKLEREEFERRQQAEIMDKEMAKKIQVLCLLELNHSHYVRVFKAVSIRLSVRYYLFVVESGKGFYLILDYSLNIVSYVFKLFNSFVSDEVISSLKIHLPFRPFFSRLSCFMGTYYVMHLIGILSLYQSRKAIAD